MHAPGGTDLRRAGGDLLAERTLQSAARPPAGLALPSADPALGVFRRFSSCGQRAGGADAHLLHGRLERSIEAAALAYRSLPVGIAERLAFEAVSQPLAALRR